MGRSACCEKEGLKKGPWTPEEDQKLLAYIEENGHGSWRALPAKAGLQRCGKSCRLRWTNYLRPDIKRGKFSLQEEQTIIQLHALLGNRWSAIATHLPKRTDNEIKNYWNTHLKKRLTKMGIDPVTHKPRNDALQSLGDGQSKDAANLSHMAQWESARLEAEARLVRESKLGSSSSNSNPFQHQLGSSTSAQLFNRAAALTAPTQCLDVLKAWQGVWSKSTKDSAISGMVAVSGDGCDIDSPTSTLNFSENALPVQTVGGFGANSPAAVEFVGNSGACEGGYVKEGGEHDWKGFGKSHQLPEFRERIENSMAAFHIDTSYSTKATWIADSQRTGNGNGNNVHVPLSNYMEGFTDLLPHDSTNHHNSWNSGVTTANADGSCGGDFEENKNYWNSVLNLVNSWPSDSPVF